MMMKKMSAVLLSGLLASQMVWAETGKKSNEIFGAGGAVESDSNAKWGSKPASSPKSENESSSKEPIWGAPFGRIVGSK